jgi:hypothetical protein
MIWAWLRKAPKIALVLFVFVGSNALFGIWWLSRPGKQSGYGGAPVAAVVDNGPKILRIEAAPERLILVDHDLYDLDSGAVIFRNWLQKDMPQRLFYDADAKKMIAQYQLGFVRYNLDGTVQATLLQQFEPAISKDLKWILYVKDKDIWRADIDWDGFKLVNERQITSIEQFWPQNFAENIMFWTDKSLVVRNLATLLGVNLETGNVTPVRIPLNEIAKRRSPDGKRVVGAENGVLYCYDLESNTTKTIRIGRLALNDYQWVGNDKVVAIAAGRAVVSYDRLNNTLNEVLQLPMMCTKIQAPSPDGRFVFCSDWKGAYLVDLEKRTATPFTGGAGVEWVNNDTVIFSREVPDTALRGTWLETAGEGERRISPEPYLVNRTGPEIMKLKSAGVLVLATEHGLSKMKPDGSEEAEIVMLARPPGRVLAIESWK